MGLYHLSAVFHFHEHNDWEELILVRLPFVLLFIIRFMMTYAFINHVGQKKNTLFGKCPYTAWTIYLGMILSTYFGLAYWFYTRDRYHTMKITFVLV